MERCGLRILKRGVDANTVKKNVGVATILLTLDKCLVEDFKSDELWPMHHIFPNHCTSVFVV